MGNRETILHARSRRRGDDEVAPSRRCDHPTGAPADPVIHPPSTARADGHAPIPCDWQRPVSGHL